MSKNKEKGKEIFFCLHDAVCQIIMFFLSFLIEKSLSQGKEKRIKKFPCFVL
jgi:hypothetical protein